MNSTQYFVATSLDGFIATTDDDLAWLFEFNGADGQEAAYQRFYDGVGALIMGADTFRFLLSQDLDAWPYPDVPTWVFSHRDRLGETAFDGADIRFVQGDVQPIHREALAAAGEKNLWLVGGGNLVAQFQELGLLDELLLTLIPTVLGAGKPLLPLKSPTLPLELLEHTVLGKGMVELRYRVSGPSPAPTEFSHAKH